MANFITDCHVDDRGLCQSVGMRSNGTPISSWEMAPRVLERFLSGELRGNEAFDVALEMRHNKHSLPIMGVVSAYLYDARGDLETIRKMASFYSHREQFIPYDLAVLGLLPCQLEEGGRIIAEVPATERIEPYTEREKQYAEYFAATEACTVPVAGRFPLLTVGWQQLGTHLPEALLADGLIEVGAGLKPQAPFTTLDARAGRKLIEILS